MEVHEEQVNGVTALTVKGRLDSSSAAAFGSTLEAIVAAPRNRLVVDFGYLEYLSSAGFRVLLVAAKRADQVGSPRRLSASTCSRVRPLR